jgi:hypothetical protein
MMEGDKVGVVDGCTGSVPLGLARVVGQIGIAASSFFSYFFFPFNFQKREKERAWER